jgi:hypothetical protein
VFINFLPRSAGGPELLSGQKFISASEDKKIRRRSRTLNY